jgi:hypothetical protein
MIVLRKNICGSGHPALEKKGGEMLVLKLYFIISVVGWSTWFLLLKGGVP